MYEPLLVIHSWVRWIVFVSMIYFLCVSLRSLVTRRAWSESDSHFIWAFNQVFLYQALFGFVLWLTSSPIVRNGFLNPNTILSQPLTTFWTLIHPLTMIASIGVFHLGKAYSKKRPIESRFKIFAITFAIILTMISCAIPWPFLSHGRPLIRMF